jgi:hypothetical protein
VTQVWATPSKEPGAGSKNSYRKKYMGMEGPNKSEPKEKRDVAGRLGKLTRVVAFGAALMGGNAQAQEVKNTNFKDSNTVQIEKYSSSLDIQILDKEFSKSFSIFAKDFKGLKTTIENSAAIFNETAETKIINDTIENLRTRVSKNLTAVADNGEVTKYVTLALSKAVEKRKELQQDKRFSQEERVKLSEGWEKQIEIIKASNEVVEAARFYLLDLMYILQNKEELITEFTAVQSPQEVLTVARQLPKELAAAMLEYPSLVALFQPANE